MKKVKGKIIASLIFFSIISISIFFSNSSYISKIFFESKNEIDTPVINVIANEKININSVNCKTVFEDIKFKITNYNNDIVNTSKINYCIQIIDGLENEYLEYVVINNKTNEEIKVENKKTKYMSLKVGTKEDTEYTLKIKNKLPKNIEESNIDIKLKLIAIQEK